MINYEAPAHWLEGSDEEHHDETSLRTTPKGSGERLVRQGECVYSIAEEHGVGWQEIWNHPENADLKESRKEPGMLLPGDRIAVPVTQPQRFDVQTGSRHVFHSHVGFVEVTLTLLENGTPRRNIAWTLKGQGLAREGTTDGQGTLRTRVPARLRRAELKLRIGEDHEVTHDLVFGAIDPLESVSGVQGRLANLGYYKGQVDGVMGPKTRAALKSFQSVQGIRAVGRIDRETLDRLEQAHGS